MNQIVIRQTLNGWVVTEDDGWMSNEDLAACHVFNRVHDMVEHLSRVWGVKFSSKPDIVFETDTKKYRARLTVNGKRKHIGRFVTRADAETAWIEATRNLSPKEGKAL